MRCSSCATDNPADSSFCENCGCALEVTCASCGTSARAGSKFCRKCGARIGDAAIGDAVATKNAAPGPVPTPGHLVEKILRSRSAIEGERKQVTVLFADVKGSMELAEQLDPEEWSAIMQRFFSILTKGVERFEGFVDKFTGDGIMALFGAPLAHEDHAQRACYAALHLRDSLRQYADELRRTKGVSLSVRIGINSGEVVVGNIGQSGESVRMDYTAQGHTVGLAQRMEQRAAADSAYLTEHTARLVKGYFELRSLGAFELKGVTAPIGGFELTGVGDLRSRLDRSRARGFSKLVGRTNEMAALEAILDRTLDGHGGVAGVVADAGVGKSRLCMEFVEHCRAQGVAVYEAHCPSHGKAVPLLPVLELFRSYFGITSQDSDQLAREKIAGRILLLDRELESFVPLAFEFLGVPDPDRPAGDVAPAIRQRQLFAFTRMLIQARSAREPAVLFVDDVHWIDDGSDAFIAQVADVVPNTRTMLLLNFRPEYNAEWMTRATYQQLPLAPLGSEAIDELLADLLGADPSTAALPALVRERTAGNPFFIEETIHSLVESGSLVGRSGAYRLEGPIEKLDLPPTVHGILAARIDRLAERDKLLLQTAAVIGRKFAGSLLLRVCGLSEAEFEAAIVALRHAEFIHEESFYPEVEYAFRHPLTQEVAERSQLAAQRRRVHLAVAGVLEELLADKPDENAALLAHHWDLGGDVVQAALWHRRAAEWIAGSNAPESRRHWQRVRELAEQIAEPALALELGQQSRLMILEYGWRLGLSVAEVNELLSEGEGWARRHDDGRALAALYNAFSMPCVFNLGDTRRARDLCETGCSLAEAAGDTALACALELRIYFCANAIGDVHGMVAAMDRVLARSQDDRRRASSLVGYDVPAAVACWRVWPTALSGKLKAALEQARHALELARAADAVEVIMWIRWTESMIWYERGDGARAGALAREALEIAERIDNPLFKALALRYVGRACALEGDNNAALPILSRAQALLATVHLVSEPDAWVDLALAHCALGALAEAQNAAERALELAAERGSEMAQVIANHALARIQLERGGDGALASASLLIDQARAEAEGLGNHVIMPHVYELRGRVARQAGDAGAAEIAFGRAQQLFQEIGAELHAERLIRETAAS